MVNNPRIGDDAISGARDSSQRSGTSSRVGFHRTSADVHDRGEDRSLLAGFRDEDDDGLLGGGARWPVEEHATRSSLYLLLLTLGGFGLQMGWSAQMTNGSPYLLSLGFDKALLALVWIAGPLSGILVQPYVGIKSDRCRSRWGKRRPFIATGAIGTVFSILALAWAKTVVAGFLGIFGAAPDSGLVSISIMGYAIFFIYALDFSINVLQAALRAYAVDSVPTHQQDNVNAWVTRVQGVGHIFGMFCSGINLPKWLPFLGNTQFRVLGAVAAISMAVTTSISISSVKERDPRLDTKHSKSDDSMLTVFKDLYRSLFRLPPQIAKVCWVQFFAWMGWFPFLFYTTTYIGGIYTDPYFRENPNRSKEEIDDLWERGTRRGSIGLLLTAIVVFTSSVFLPFIIQPTYHSPKVNQDPGTPLTPSLSRSTMSDYLSAKSKPTWHRKISSAVNTFLKSIRVKGLTLRRAWIMSHIVYAIAMWATLFVHSVRAATVLVGIVGVPWAITQWAPWALISSEISKREDIRRGAIRAPATRDGQLLASGEDDAADQAGVVLGIHNVAISAPQVVATLVGSLLFKAIQKDRGTPGDESVAWFMRLGGLCALVAAYLTMRVEEEKADLVLDSE